MNARQFGCFEVADSLSHFKAFEDSRHCYQVGRVKLTGQLGLLDIHENIVKHLVPLYHLNISTSQHFPFNLLYVLLTYTVSGWKVSHLS